MQRYIAFAWNTQVGENNSTVKTLARRLTSRPVGWECALDTAGLLVYHVERTGRVSKACKLDRSGGVVIGKAFARDTLGEINTGEVQFTRQETDQILRSEGRYLIEQYWGSYVAIVKEELAPRVWLLRDPTGGVPCFISKFRGIHVVCSHVEDSAAIGVIGSAINWEHIAAYLWFDHIVAKDTGLEGVQQVQAGECIVIGADSTNSKYYWSPDRVYRARTVEDHQQATLELRDTIRNCVKTWASCYTNILHELSGGLDSAVVLACLPSVPQASNILCENYFTHTPEGDERTFARQAANLADVELIETAIPASGDRSLDTMFQFTRCATPTHTIFRPATLSAREAIVKARHIEAVFSGQGGDHFFQRSHTPQIAAEYAWRHGFGPELFRVISDTSRFTRKSVWTIIGAVISSGFLGRHENPYGRMKSPRLLSDVTRDAINQSCLRHPWVDAAEGLPGSKQQQIFHIIDSQIAHLLPSHYADIVHPLISQPIIELCLQIPSYVLTYGGIDRALVRDAFEGLIPADIIARTSKGATTGYFNDLLLRNLPYLREFLLDGLLVTHGVLDKQKTEDVLCETSLIREAELLFPILDAARAEGWLRAWLWPSHRAAA